MEKKIKIVLPERYIDEVHLRPILSDEDMKIYFKVMKRVNPYQNLTLEKVIVELDKEINLYRTKNLTKMKERLYCSECGAIIEGTCYRCLDNFMKAKFFDTDEENCFCSKECFCKYLNLVQIEIEKHDCKNKI